MRLLASRPLLILLVVIGLFTGLWAVYPHEFVASDPWAYSSRAFGILERLDFGDNHPFSHRLGITVPTAAIYALFGVDLWTTHVWPLCAALLIIVVVWKALPDRRSKVLGALLCLSGVALVRASTDLFPDLVAAAFMAASSLVLFRRRELIDTRRPAWLIGVLAIGLLFAAFLAKESAYWLLPLWLGAAATDIRHPSWPTLWRRFYLPAAIAGLVLGVSYLLFCDVVWGSPLARVAAIQALTGQHFWALDQTSVREMIKRLTIGPVELLIAEYGVPILALAGVGLALAPPRVKVWGWYAGTCLFLYWFGSTSLTRYEPMPLAERMTLPALPGLYILAAYGASRLSVVAAAGSRTASWLPIALVACLVGAPFARELLSWRGHPRAEAHAMSIVRADVAAHQGVKYLLVCSDPRSPEALAFYFGYHYPSNIRVMSVAEFLDGTSPPGADRVFLFAHSARSRFMTEFHHADTYDREIADAGVAPAYQEDGVSLWVSDDVGGLRTRLLTTAVHFVTTAKPTAQVE